MLFITREEELQIDLPLQALYFYASWMPYHNKFLTMISKIEDKYKDISFSAIDVEEFKNQCKRFSIDSVPTVIVLKGGKEVKRINGLVLTSAFKSAFADICTS
jgi:thioredoxin-like negative regulator of GroEL